MYYKSTDMLKYVTENSTETQDLAQVANSLISEKHECLCLCEQLQFYDNQ